MHHNKLSQKIEKRESVISIIGLGYVGLPLALKFVQAGYYVKGIDISQKKIESLKNAKSYISNITDEELDHLASSNLFEATYDYSAITDCDVIIICLPTPLTPHKEPDLSYITNASHKIANYLEKEKLIILESTVYPGATRDKLVPIMESSGFETGKDIFIGYSPERIDPGNKKYDISEIPKVISGITPNCLTIVEKLYKKIFRNLHKVSSPEVAEASKLLENIQRAVNIALVNEMKIILDKLNIDIWEVVEAASSKPFGFTPYYPGPGFGGHCIPIDPYYMSWKAKELDLSAKFIELAGDVNRYIPNYVVQKVGDCLNKFRKNYNGSKILVLGVAYKKDINDFRESPALKIIHMLEKKNAHVEYNDNYIKELKVKWHNLNFNIDKKSLDLDYNILNTFDCVLIVTDHSYYDWEKIVDHSNAIVDTRNATAHIKHGREKIIKA